MSGRLEGKVALITGAARGQGRSHAVRFAEEGADVIAVDVCDDLGTPYPAATGQDLEETARLVGRTGRRIVTAPVDVRDLDALRGVVDAAVSELGGLDTVVANAAICVPAMWDRVTPELFEAHMSTNVTGVWNTAMVGAPHLVARGGGSMILVSSAAGITVQPFLVPYTTSKFAVRGMAKAFAAELGEYGVRVNSVHPSAVRTPMGSSDVLAIVGEGLEAHPRLAGMFTNILPVEQLEPEDITGTVLFLASEESRSMTAHELVPDAGVTEY